MRDDQRHFLNLARLPVFLSVEQTAWFLNIERNDVAILVARGLLKPCGDPPRNGTKRFATAALEALKNDSKWHHRAADALVRYWREKRERRAASYEANPAA